MARGRLSKTMLTTRAKAFRRYKRQRVRKAVVVPNRTTTTAPSKARGRESQLLQIMLADQSYWRSVRLVPTND